MAQDPELEELKTRVHTEGLGPLQDALDPIIANLRQSTIEHPFMAICVALQAGYFVGKLVRRYAQR